MKVMITKSPTGAWYDDKLVEVIDVIDRSENYYECIGGGYINKDRCRSVIQVIARHTCKNVIGEIYITEDKIYDAVDSGDWYRLKDDMGRLINLSKCIFNPINKGSIQAQIDNLQAQINELKQKQSDEIEIEVGQVWENESGKRVIVVYIGSDWVKTYNENKNMDDVIYKKGFGHNYTLIGKSDPFLRS